MAESETSLQKIPLHALPDNIRLAILAVKNSVRNKLPGDEKVFDNRSALLPSLDEGCEYYEFDLGSSPSRRSQREGQSDKRYLVIEVERQTRKIGAMYFADECYNGGSFCVLR